MLAVILPAFVAWAWITSCPFAVSAELLSMPAGSPRRPLPVWFDDAKLGIFLHWGLYSVPGYAPKSGETAEVVAKGGWELWFAQHPGAEWYANSLRIPGSPVQSFHRQTYGRDFNYEDFVPRFHEASAGSKPAQWAELFRQAGARYVVLWVKHHDGFLLWPSPTPSRGRGLPFASSRDWPGEVSRATREAGLKFGVAYSAGLDWSVTTRPITNIAEVFISAPTQTNYLTAVDRHWRELIQAYKPDVLWNDLGCPPDFRIKALHEEYFSEVPEGVVNDRFDLGLYPGSGPRPAADFSTPALEARDRQQGRPFEVSRPLGTSPGFHREETAADLLPFDDLVRLFVDVVARNGRLSLMIGPDAQGRIAAPHRKRLEELGAWMNIHGESLHGSRPWLVSAMRSPEGLELRFTERGTNWFVHVLNPGRASALTLNPFRWMPGTEVRVLGSEAAPAWKQQQNALRVELPATKPGQAVVTLRISPQPVWLAKP